jgi:hypothetical protein
MSRIVRISMIVVLLAGGIALLGCSKTVIRARGTSATTTVEADKPGPPPHAPAHGYRHKHGDGVVLVFEKSLGVYVVSGYRDVYFQDNRFFRLHKNTWQSSDHIKGPWHKASERKIPPGLQQGVAEKGKGKAKGKNK